MHSCAGAHETLPGEAAEARRRPQRALLRGRSGEQALIVVTLLLPLLI